MQTDDKENRPSQATQTEKEADDAFWSLAELSPRRRYTIALPQDTQTVLLTQQADAHAQAQALAEGARPIVRQVPISHRGKPHAPADVRPQMCEPVFSYAPQHPLLQQVHISRWPERYRFFDRFLHDAERFWEREGLPCAYEPFYAYMPQYHQMTPAQTRYYFYWRSCVRREEYPRTDYSYLFLYLYELIHLGSGAYGVNETAAAMARLWAAYRRTFARLDRYIGEWLCDYCLIHRCNAPLSVIAPFAPEILDKVSLKEFYILPGSDLQTLFSPSLCDALSDYDWRTSRFCTDRTKPLFIEHLYGAVRAYLTALTEQGMPLRESLGLVPVRQSRDAFSGALCAYSAKRKIEVEVLSISRSYALRCTVSDAFKFAENCIRAHQGIRARLGTPSLNAQGKEMICAYFAKHLPPQAKPVPSAKRHVPTETPAPYEALYQTQQTDISAEQARRIEHDSWQTTQLLLTQMPLEEPQTQPPQDAQQVRSTPQEAGLPTSQALSQMPPLNCEALVSFLHTDADATLSNADTPDDPYGAFITSLQTEEYAALCAVLGGDKPRFMAAAQRLLLLPDALAERLNEKALGTISDAAVQPDGAGFYHLSDYYANEITAAIIAQEEGGETIS